MKSEHKIDLGKLRAELREVDDQLMELICRRVEVVKKIGSIKTATDLPVQDLEQEARNLQKNRDVTAGRAPAVFVDELTELLARWSRHIQSAQP